MREGEGSEVREGSETQEGSEVRGGPATETGSEARGGPATETGSEARGGVPVRVAEAAGADVEVEVEHPLHPSVARAAAGPAGGSSRERPWAQLEVDFSSESWQGPKLTQEDRVREGVTLGPLGVYFGLFDGHGGDFCVDYVCQRLHKALAGEYRQRGGYVESPGVAVPERLRGLEGATFHALADSVSSYAQLCALGGQDQESQERVSLMRSELEGTLREVRRIIGINIPPLQTLMEGNLMTLKSVPPLMTPQVKKIIKDSFVSAFKETDKSYIQLARRKMQRGGSTGLVCMVYGAYPEDAHLIMANLGDCRAVLCRGGEAVALTEDHKPGTRGERRRIEQFGGRVINLGGIWRVSTAAAIGYSMSSVANTFLSVSRTFGNFEFKEPVNLVSNIPDVEVVALQPEDLFVVLACDGIWDVLDNQAVVDLAAQHMGDPKAAARAVLEAAARSSRDNMTVTVVQFRWNLSVAGRVLKAYKHTRAQVSQDSEVDILSNE